MFGSHGSSTVDNQARPVASAPCSANYQDFTFNAITAALMQVKLFRSCNITVLPERLRQLHTSVTMRDVPKAVPLRWGELVLPSVTGTNSQGPIGKVYDVFNFNVNRSTKKADPTQALKIEPSSDFLKQISQINIGAAVRNRLTLATGDPYLSDLTTLTFYQAYQSFATYVQAGKTTFNGIVKEIQTDFGESPASLVQDVKFTTDKTRISEAIVLIWSSPNGVPSGGVANTTTLELYLRLIGIVERAANGDQTLNSPDVVQSALQTALVLPFQPSPSQLHSVGVKDLYVVKKRLIDYEPYDISYIYNILKSESSKRTTVYTQSSTETTTTTTELTQETSKDLQIDERFNLQSEVDNVVQNAASLQGGLSASYNYGTTLSVNANVSASTSTSSQDSSKQATDYSKDVLSKASSQVTQKVTQSRTITVMESFTETNEHGFNNVRGASNIAGIYQFVDEIYQAQVFNYGKRLLFDVVIPEPAAFIIDAIVARNNKQLSANKPPPITFSASDLTDQQNPASPLVNYMDVAKQYGVAGLTPPPDPIVTIEHTEMFGPQPGTPTPSFWTKDVDLVVPQGYHADAVDLSVTIGGGANHSIWLNLGTGWSHVDGGNGMQQSISLGRLNEVPAPGQTGGTIPLAITAWPTDNTYAINLEIQCNPTAIATAAWQNKTFDAIVTEYLKLLSDYTSAQMAAAAASTGTQFLGSSQDENARIMQTELKKSFLAMFSGEPPGSEFQSYGAITTAVGNVSPLTPPFTSLQEPTGCWPEIDTNPALDQGKKIRFLEETFEWANMQFVFYPYYWGRKACWYDKVLSEDPDPNFAAFLRAGAARVVVPVRRFWEDAVNYYLNTGQVWNGGDLPDVTSPLYLDISEEIKEIEDGPTVDAPVAASAPWQFKLPTTQVYLRSDGLLPYWYQDPTTADWLPGTWKQDANGNWIHEWIEQADGTWVQQKG
jgi:hypothetical protein